MSFRPGPAPRSGSASTPGRAVFVSSPCHRTGSLILKGDTEKDKKSKEFFTADPGDRGPCLWRRQDAACVRPWAGRTASGSSIRTHWTKEGPQSSRKLEAF